jgi:hypothetical protein
MVKMNDTVFCDGCGVEILLSPVVKDHGEYCCEDCAQGYECECGKQMDEKLGGDLDSDLSIPGAL